MVEYGLEWARDNGLLKVALSVFETNRRAVALYEKFGFAREGRRPAQYVIQGQPVAEIPMGLVLGSQATGC
jgi:ribosomal protein S18 acetylase RimI-like enzyme